MARSTKIHALKDRLCRPNFFLLTGGRVADCKAGLVLLERMPACAVLHADKGYDTDAIRRQIETNTTLPQSRSASKVMNCARFWS